MTQRVVNRAKVLLALCQEKDQVDNLKEVFTSNQELTQVLCAPVVSWEKKCKVIDKVSEKAGISKLLSDFIKIAARDGEIASLPEIFSAYYGLYNQKKGIVLCSLQFAKEPAKSERKQIEAEIAEHFPGKQVEFRTEIREELLGGYLAKAGGLEFDRSYEGYLQELERQLV